jgi:hypothetical protein
MAKQSFFPVRCSAISTEQPSRSNQPFGVASYAINKKILMKRVNGGPHNRHNFSASSHRRKLKIDHGAIDELEPALPPVVGDIGLCPISSNALMLNQKALLFWPHVLQETANDPL